MSPIELLAISFKSVWANKLRSALTILGNVISVAFIIAVIAGIQGVNENVSAQLMRQGTNVFTVTRFGMVFSQEEWRRVQNNPAITLDDAEAIRNFLGGRAIVAAGGGVSGTVMAEGQELEGVPIRGRSHENARVENIEIAEGRYIASFDEIRRRNVVVLGAGVADALFGNLSCIGRIVYINGWRYEVIGRAEGRGSFMGSSMDNWVEIPVTTLLAQFGSQLSLSVNVRVQNQGLMRSVMEDVTMLMRQRRRLRPGEMNNFDLVASDAFMELYHSITRNIYAVLVAVTGLSLIVGGIVIANIMLAVVNERIRENCVRKALGARRRHILYQFLVESVTLSLFGGLIGAGAGWVFAWALREWTPLPASVHAWSVALALLTVLVVGMASGLGPAIRAARLNPVEALRYE